MNNEEIRKKEEIESALAAMVDDDFLETSKDLLTVWATVATGLQTSREQRITLSGGFQPETKTLTQSRNFARTWNQ